jgi:hypothetical protein
VPWCFPAPLRTIPERDDVIATDWGFKWEWNAATVSVLAQGLLRDHRRAHLLA